MTHVLLAGSRGNLGSAFQDFFRANQISFEPLYWESFDVESLVKSLEKKPGYLINCAAVSSRDYSREHPYKTWEANVQGVWRQLEMIRLHSPSTKYVAFGTVYESDSWDLSPYACSKRMMRELVECYRKMGLWVLCPSLGLTEYRRGEGFLTSKIIKGAKQIAAEIWDNKPFEPLQLYNVEEKMKFAYGMDVVETVWALLQQEMPNDIEMEGEEISVSEFVIRVFDALELHASWRINFASGGDVELWTRDYLLARGVKRWPKEIHASFTVEMDPKDVQTLYDAIPKWKGKTSPQQMIKKLVELEIAQP